MPTPELVFSISFLYIIVMIEEWRDVKGYEGLYQVSNLGRVKRITSGRILKANVRFSNNGKYKRTYVALSKHSIEKHFYIHKLVALAFPDICGEPFDGAEIDHLDGDATNNIASNIRWVTHTDNLNNPIYRQRKSETATGKKHTEEQKQKISKALTNGKTSKKVFQYSLDGEFIKEWESVNEARRNGYSNAFACLSGRQKQAYNCLWTYKEKGGA